METVESSPQRAPAKLLQVAETLQTSFKVIGANFGTFMVTSALVSFPASAIGLLIAVSMHDANVADMRSQNVQRILMSLVRMMPIYLVWGLAMGAVFAVVQAAIMHSTVESLAGRKAHFGASMRTALLRAWPVVPCALLVGLVITLGSFFCLVPGLVVSIPLMVAVPVCAMERLGPIASIRRSAQLTEGNWLPIFAIVMIMIAAYFGFAFCVVTPISVFSAASAGVGEIPHPLSPVQLLVQFLGFVFQTLQLMVLSTITAVVYARLRGLRDGVDAQALAGIFA